MDADRPPTTTLCTTVAMLSSAAHHVSGAYRADVDLIPVWNPSKNGG